jgi:hypothetical protein
LTDPLVGHWCRVGQGNGDARGANNYRRGVWTCDGNLVIKPDGYDGRFVGSSCTFFDVRRSKNGWVTHADCDDNVYQSAEFKIIGKTLHYRELATSWPENGERTAITCGHVADNMPDGFLALRAGPGTHYIMKARLNTRDNLELGETTKKGWTSVSVSLGKGKEIHGWVYHKYVEYDSDQPCKWWGMTKTPTLAAVLG